MPCDVAAATVVRNHLLYIAQSLTSCGGCRLLVDSLRAHLVCGVTIYGRVNGYIILAPGH